MPTLVRRLGLWSSIDIVIGITIGGGIFRTPAGIATRVRAVREQYPFLRDRR